MRLREGALVAATVVVAAAAWLAVDRRGAPRVAGPSGVEPTCAEAYGWVDRDDALVDVTSTHVLATSDVLRACLAGPGVLSLRLRGSELAGTGAYAVVALGLENLWEGFVTDPIELRLDVPRAGTALLTFVNDRYEPPEDRNLWVSDVAFIPR